MTKSYTILGIDPGSLVTGVACVESQSCEAVLPSQFKIIDILKPYLMFHRMNVNINL